MPTYHNKHDTDRRESPQITINTKQKFHHGYGFGLDRRERERERGGKSLRGFEI